MELKLDAKLMKAVNGLMLFAIAIIYMATSITKLVPQLAEKDASTIGWLPGLFLLFGACALCYGWFIDGKKDCVLATRAGFYALLAIIFFANKAVASDTGVLMIWAMMEGALLLFDGFKAKEAKANLWEAVACFGALVIVLAFIALLVINETYYVNKMIDAAKAGKEIDTIKMTFEGVVLLFVALGNLFPMCADYLPKCELKLKK